jgi:hypothetical protein
MAMEEPAKSLYSRCVCENKHYDHPSKKYDYQYGMFDKMMHGLVASKTTLRSGEDHDAWDVFYPESVASQQDRICLANWIGAVGGISLTTEKGINKRSDAVFEIIQTALKQWAEEAWTGVDVEPELLKMLPQYTHYDVMGEAGRQPWRESQEVFHAFLKGWDEAVRNPEDPTHPPRLLNNPIISIQMVGAADPTRVSYSLAITLNDWIAKMKNAPDGLKPSDQTLKMIDLCLILGDRAILAAVGDENQTEDLVTTDRPRRPRQL